MNHFSPIRIQIFDKQFEKMNFYQEIYKQLRFTYSIPHHLRQEQLRVEYTGDIIPTLAPGDDEIYNTYEKQATQIRQKYLLKTTFKFENIDIILDMLTSFRKKRVTFRYSKQGGFIMYVKEEPSDDHNTLTVSSNHPIFNALTPSRLKFLKKITRSKQPKTSVTKSQSKPHLLASSISNRFQIHLRHC